MSNLYTQMKIFHYKDKIDSLPQQNETILAPLHLRIKPTNVCNHNCSYCAYRVDHMQLGKDMDIRDFIPKEKILEIIDDIAEMGVKAVTFSGGGDPLCYPFLLDAAEALSKTSVKFAALTNGARLDGDVAAIFAQHATWIRISIDGWDDQSYSTYRNVPEGEFTKVLRNISNFAHIKDHCFLGASVIVRQENAAHLYELSKKLKDVGVDSIKFPPCLVSNSGVETNNYHEAISDIVKEQIAKVKQDFESSTLQIFDSYHDQLESFQKSYEWCPYMQILSIIGADLNVYSCQDKAYNFDCGTLGSIKNIRFKDFWFLNKDKFFQINPSKVCNHHCVSDCKNKLLFEYLHADPEHLAFV